MNNIETKTEAELTILCVDDESDILQAMKRLLRKSNYKLLLVKSGAMALEAMQKNKVHIVICDMRMPQMSGDELLEKVARSNPECYRILLTGYADMESTINAVNKGKIHRHIQKPWNNEELVSAIEEGADKVKLTLENARLQHLVKKQNARLKELNHSLEEKVQLRTKQIRSVLHKIEYNNSATQKVLYNLININPEINSEFAHSVSKLSKKIAKQLKLSKEEIKDITYASLICEIGLLGLDPTIYSKPFNELNYQQQKEYTEQGNIAQLVLGPAEYLHNVSEIIVNQFEWHNGKGPKRLFDLEIPIGAKILCITRDFWRYKLGRLNPEILEEKAIQTEMTKFMGTRYDPEVLELLFKTIKNPIPDPIYALIPIEKLEPGMELKHNLFNRAHILILPEGHVFSEKTIAKLLHYEKSQNEPISVTVRK